MNGAFYIGATALSVQQRSLDTIAQNVSNMNTTAYKRAETRFAELVTQPATGEEVGVPVPVDLAGVRVSRTVRVFAQGDLRETGKPLDLAISGDGFLEVLGPGGQTYLWRGGSLRVGIDGALETSDGLQLRNQVQVPEDSTDLRIERDGRVRALAAGSEELVEIGRLEVVLPDQVDNLVPIDGGYYLIDDAATLRSFAAGEEGKGVFIQGSLEAANVDLGTEMVGLLLAQRAYGASAQVVQAGDQLMAIANGLRR